MSARILWTTDWHLGYLTKKHPDPYVQIGDIRRILQFAVDHMITDVVVSGDISDTSELSSALSSAFLGVLLEFDGLVNVFLLAGNHDYCHDDLTAADLVPQVLAGYDAVVGGAKAELADPNGFAFDTKLRTRLALAAQQQITLPGAPAPMPNLSGNISSLGGLPVAFGRTVAGRVGTQADTKTKGFVGDWNNGLRWGFVDQIDIQRSNEATIMGADGQPIYLFQQNAQALLIEFSIGWAVMDPAYFAAYDDKV